MSEREDVEALAEAFHDAYERAAAGLGWETQERSRVPWADVPEANKETMRATLRAVMPAHAERVRAEAWQVGHDAACPQGLVCSAHQPPYRAVLPPERLAGEGGAAE